MSSASSSSSPPPFEEGTLSSHNIEANNNNNQEQEAFLIIDNAKHEVAMIKKQILEAKTKIQQIELWEAAYLRQALGEIFHNYRQQQQLELNLLQQQQQHFIVDENDEDDNEEEDGGGNGEGGDEDEGNEPLLLLPVEINPNDNNNDNMAEAGEGEEEHDQEEEFIVRRRHRHHDDLLSSSSSLMLSSNNIIEEGFLMLISKFSPNIINKAILMTTTDTTNLLTKSSSSSSYNNNNNNNNLRLPIHLACEYSAPIPIIKKLLEYDIHKKSVIAKDIWGDLPIHIACSRGTDYSNVVKLLLEADKETPKSTIHVKDCNDYMPIHMACRYWSSSSFDDSSTINYNIMDDDSSISSSIVFNNIKMLQSMEASRSTIKLLIDSDKSKTTLLEEGIHGQYPIHILCRNQSITPSILKVLLEADKINGLKSVLKADDGDRIPIHVYLSASNNSRLLMMTTNNNNNNKWKLNIIQVLLEGMIVGRISRHGLDNFKKQITKLCYETIKVGIQTERDIIIEDIMVVVNHAIEEMLLKRVFVMELICWKVSLLLLKLTEEEEAAAAAVTTTKASSANSCDDLIASSSLPSSQEERKQARIKSGADIIIREVLPFLEYEPISSILTTLEKDFFPTTTTTTVQTYN